MHTSYTFACRSPVMVEPALLDVAHRYRLTQRRERIAGRDELVCHEPGEARVGDGRCDRVPVQLLRTVQLMATRHVFCVIIRQPPTVTLFPYTTLFRPGR